LGLLGVDGIQVIKTAAYELLPARRRPGRLAREPVAAEVFTVLLSRGPS